MYCSLLFLLSLFSYLIRIYVVQHVGIYLPHLFPLVLSVGAGQALPLPSPSSSSSFTEDSFEIDVLLEPGSKKYKFGIFFTNSNRESRGSLEEEFSYPLFLLNKIRSGANIGRK